MNRPSIPLRPALGALLLSTFLAMLTAPGCTPRDTTPEAQRPEGIDYYVRGEEAWRTGDKKRAEDEYRAAVQRNPNLRMAHSRLGDIHKGRGEYEKASRHFESVTRLDPYNYSSHYNLALSYQFLNRLQESAASYLRALNLNPRDMRSNMNLGLVYLALGQSDDAVRYLNRAVELDPKSAVAWSNLGVALDARGDTAQAETRYRRSLELDSASATTLQNLASNLLTQGKGGEALAVMEEVVERVDTAGTRKRYGDALAQSRKFPEALQQYDIALKRDPRYYPAMNEKAFLLIRQFRDGLELDAEKRKTAIALWRESLKLNANQPAIKRQLEKAENPQLFGTQSELAHIVPANTALEILFEDENLVAVNKPAGLATIPGRGETDSVLERLSAQLGLAHKGSDDPRLRVVHRLDKDTSGVLLFAKNVPAQRHLSHQFQNNAVIKEYLAIVAGYPDAAEGDIDAPIGPHPTRRQRMAVLKRGGRPARTLWKLEQRFRSFAVLRAFPQTGKTHQIRVHLAHAGMPLAVDPLYNPPRQGAAGGLFLSSFKRDYRQKRGQAERPLIDRLTLHAGSIRFRASAGPELTTVEAPLPKDFRAAINMLRKHG